MRNASIALLAGGLFLISACDDDGVTVIQPPEEGSVTADIDQSPWQASAELIVEVQGGTASITGTDGQGRVVSLGFVVDQGPGTYTVGQAFGPNASLTIGDEVWLASAGVGSGTLTLVTVTEDRLEGTFEFGVVATAEGVDPQTRTLSNGVFEVVH